MIAPPPSVAHHRHGMRVSLVSLVLLVLLLLAVLVAAGIGSVHLSVVQVWLGLCAGPRGQTVAARIVWLLRLPRVLMATLVGASLAASGMAFQSLLRNNLADPYLIGVSAGASVGAEAVLLRGSEDAVRGLAVPLAAFASATTAMTIVYALARRGGRVLVTSLLLGGVVISAFLGGVSTLLMELGHPDDVQRIQYRLNGNLQDATFAQCGIVGVFLIVGFLLLLGQTRAMNLFSLGEESAQHLGLDVERFKTTLILTGSLLTAATVAFAGIIGFVGLIVPHIARRLSGTPDHRYVLPVATLAGALLLVLADTIARTAMPDNRELPVGLVTAFLGAPFFCYLLRRQSREL